MKHDIWNLRTLKNLLLLIAGCLVYDIGTHSFIESAQIAPGGAVGIALMVNHVTGLPVGRMTLLVNLPLLLLAWRYLSRKFTVSTAVACVVCSLILDYLIAPLFPVYGHDRLMGSLYGGILVGAGMALIFLSGCTTGGSDIAGYLLQKKYPHIQIGLALLLVDGFILAASAPVFGDIDAALFGLVSLYVQTKVIDAVIYGTDAGTKAEIVTKQPEKIVEKILKETERSATVLKGRGGYSGDDVSVVVCTCRHSEFPRLKQLIYETDPAAFVMVTPTTSVYGLGFKNFVES